MIIKINSNDFNKVMELLNKENIENEAYVNVYSAVCAEEIDNTFYSIVEDDSKTLDKKDMNKLANELYLSGEAETAFQDLTDASVIIVNRFLNNK